MWHADGLHVVAMVRCAAKLARDRRAALIAARRCSASRRRRPRRCASARPGARHSRSCRPTSARAAGIFKKHGLDLEIAELRRRRPPAAGDGGRRHRHRARLRARPGLHRQGLAGQGHRRHGGAAAAVRAGGARRRCREDRRRPQGPQGRRLDRRLGDELDHQRDVAPARAGASTASRRCRSATTPAAIAALRIEGARRPRSSTSRWRSTSCSAAKAASCCASTTW